MCEWVPLIYIYIYTYTYIKLDISTGPNNSGVWLHSMQYYDFDKYNVVEFVVSGTNMLATEAILWFRHRQRPSVLAQSFVTRQLGIVGTYVSLQVILLSVHRPFKPKWYMYVKPIIYPAVSSSLVRTKQQRIRNFCKVHIHVHSTRFLTLNNTNIDLKWKSIKSAAREIYAINEVYE